MNTNADALSRIEIHPIESNDQDDISIIANPADPSDIPEIDADELLEFLGPPNNPNQQEIIIHDNIQLTTPRVNSENETVHSSHENPILGAPYSEKSINTYKNQIIISNSQTHKYTASREKIFDKNRLILRLPTQNTEEAIVKFAKEYLIPNQTYCIFFKDPELESTFIRNI
ncbi:hypothetical protein HHI36_010359 [Cryptolaemus montrouzieri]|uniref:Uncharacterized protein n=1 Tax=Cryptolaemus montrouzieri TaxID=559131 RepID=A0ABD2MIM8_9CUCU